MRRCASSISVSPVRSTRIRPMACPRCRADYKTFTVRIRKGIYFTDDPAFNGKQRELTAEDYVYSYKRIYDPHWNSPSYESFETIGVLGMEALRDRGHQNRPFRLRHAGRGPRTLDRYTFQIKLGIPSAPLSPEPRGLQHHGRGGPGGRREIRRRHHVAPGRHRPFQARRVAPFLVHRAGAQSRATARISFTSLPIQTMPDAQRMARELDGRRLPLIDRVEISIIEESQPRWLSFLNGEADFMLDTCRWTWPTWHCPTASPRRTC